MSTQLWQVQLFLGLYHIFCICWSLPLLSDVYRNLWFWWPSLGWRVQSLPSQDRYSLWKARIGRILCAHNFPVENLGVFHVQFFLNVFRSCVIVTSSSMIWSFSFKGVYRLCACTASLIRCSSVDLIFFLIFLSCVLHNLSIFTKPCPPPFWCRYNLIIDELGWR